MFTLHILRVFRQPQAGLSNKETILLQKLPHYTHHRPHTTGHCNQNITDSLQNKVFAPLQPNVSDKSVYLLNKNLCRPSGYLTQVSFSNPLTAEAGNIVKYCRKLTYFYPATFYSSNFLEYPIPPSSSVTKITPRVPFDSCL